jgi:hypothetical protein
VDERAQLRGEPPRLQQVVNADPSVAASYRTPDAIAFYLQPLPEGVWKNEVTVRSGRLARMYEPGSWAARVAPTPLLISVALADNITLTDVQLRAYEQMLEPKKLVTVEGGHFDPYIKQFPRASKTAVSWFRHHLAADARALNLIREGTPLSKPLQWKLFIRKRASATQGVPPGKDDLKWVANTTTLIHGEHEALLVDTFLSDAQTAELAD